MTGRCGNCGHAPADHDAFGECHAVDGPTGEPCWGICEDHPAPVVGDVEPDAADLDAIEAEWPVIEAELGVLDAEIAALSSAGGPSPLDWRRLRRARRRLLAELGHCTPVDDVTAKEAS
jgi:Family of unknown function (DUF6284)